MTTILTNRTSHASNTRHAKAVIQVSPTIYIINRFAQVLTMIGLIADNKISSSRVAMIPLNLTTMANLRIFTQYLDLLLTREKVKLERHLWIEPR